MIAIELKIDWQAEGTTEKSRISDCVRHLAPPRPDLRCPVCNALIYSRRHGICGVCGETLPSTFLFSASQVRQIERVLQKERQRHRVWMRREQAK